jgi:hypothetical protein
MSINSLDGLMNRTTNGFTYSTDWQFTTSSTAAVAGRWVDTLRFANTFQYPNTSGNLAWVQCNSSSSIAIPSGPNVNQNSESKHVFFASAMSAVTTGVPGYLMLVDLQGYWANINGTTTSTQNLTGTPVPRYTNGEGCFLYAVTVTATGTGTPSYTISYTNSSGTPARTLPITVTAAASTPLGHIHNSTTAAAGGGLFLPLAGNDTGVANVASIAFSPAHATSGEFALCLAKPLLTIPLAVVNNLNERDYITQLPSLPEVKDDACLTWLYYPGAATAANSNFYGTIEFVWG